MVTYGFVKIKLKRKQALLLSLLLQSTRLLAQRGERRGQRQHVNRLGAANFRRLPAMFLRDLLVLLLVVPLIAAEDESCKFRDSER